MRRCRMTLEYLIGIAISVVIFLSLSVVWTAMAAPLLVFMGLFLAPFMLVSFSLVSGAVMIVWAWFYDEHEVLGTEVDAVPG